MILSEQEMHQQLSLNTTAIKGNNSITNQSKFHTSQNMNYHLLKSVTGTQMDKQQTI